MLLCRIDRSKTGVTSRHFVSSMSSGRPCRDTTDARLLELTWSVQKAADDDAPGPSEVKHSNATGFCVGTNSVVLQVLRPVAVGLGTTMKSFGEREG